MSTPPEGYDEQLLFELRVNVNEGTLSALAMLAQAQGRTRSETVQNAIALAYYLDRELQTGGHLMIRRGRKLYELDFPWFARSKVSTPRQRFRGASKFRASDSVTESEEESS
jgi:hypothetical protein